MMPPKEQEQGKMRTRKQLTHATMTCLVLAACNNLLEVHLPGRVSAGTLDDPAMAEILVLSVIADFECAYAGYVGGTALLTGEMEISTHWRDTNIWAARLSDLETFGDVGCTTARSASAWGVYRPLQTARQMGEDVSERIGSFSESEVPEQAKLLATVSAYVGYSLTLLGEGFCEMAIDAGPLMSRADVWKVAEERFATAIALAATAGDGDILNMARVGRARVRLNLGNLAGAVEDAEQVPIGFIRNATYSSVNPRRENRVQVQNHDLLFISVDPEFRNLTVDGVPDPRVRAAASGFIGNDGITPVWLQFKYVTPSDPIPIATWNEAQLIIAEAKGGADAVAAINRLRSAVGLPLFDSSDPQEIRMQTIEERRRELFIQGHRINDILRLPEVEWRTGRNNHGEAYGTVTCMPLPLQERLNNPNIP